MPNDPVLQLQRVSPLVDGPLVIDPPLPEDPTLRAIADDVLAKLRHSFTMVACEEQPEARGELDQMYREFLATRKPANRALVRVNAQALLADQALRSAQFGRYAHIDRNEYRTLGSDNVARRVAPLPINPDLLRAIIDPQPSPAPHQDHPAIGPIHIPPFHYHVPDPPPDEPHLGPFGPELLDLGQGMAFKTMKLVVEKVHCWRDSDEFLEGDDEIALGGTVTLPDGQTIMVNQFKVGDDISDGDIINLGYVYCNYALVIEPQGFPYSYYAVVAMAEKDDGGFYDFIKKLWKKIEKEVKAAIAGAIGAAIGGAIGNAIGAIVGFLVGALVGWLISLFHNTDDIIAVRTLKMTLATYSKSYYDWAKLTAPKGYRDTVKFKGHGARYTVTFSYKVYH